MKNKDKIYSLLQNAYREEEKIGEFYIGRYHGPDEERFQKLDAQEKIAADAYEKAWNLIFQTFDEEGIHHISQVNDWEFEDELKNAADAAEMQIWNAKDWERSIAFNQKLLSFDWEQEDERYGGSWTLEGSLKERIASAYARKGDLEKANALFESYLQEDYARGEYWFGYINFLMEDDAEKLPSKLEELSKGIKEKKIKMADSWINDLIYNLEVSKQSKYIHILQEILDERKIANRKEEAKIQTAVKAAQTISTEQYGKYLPKKKLKELKKKGLLK